MTDEARGEDRDDPTEYGMTAKPIPPVKDTVSTGTARFLMGMGEGFLAAETSLLRRNGIDTSVVAIDTYGRMGADVAFDMFVLGDDGRVLIDGEGEDATPRTVSIARTLVVYP